MAVMAGVASAHRVPRGFTVWKYSQLAIALGSGLVAARGIIPDWASIVVGNVLLLSGLGLTTDGFGRFYGLKRRIPVWADVCVVLLAGVLFAIWSKSSLNARIVVAGTVAAYFVARTGLEPLASGEARGSSPQRVLTALNVTAAALSLVRVAWAIWGPRYTYASREGWTAIVPGLSFVTVNATSMYIALYLTFARSERDLRAVQARVKTLAGLLPICSHCHKIRNDQGYWLKLERFIVEHSEAQFTHGICPECLAANYPDRSEITK
jgi:hypothetical protein